MKERHTRMTTQIGNYLPYTVHRYKKEEYEKVFGKSEEEIEMSYRHICSDEDWGKEILMTHYLIMEQWRRLWGFIHEHRPRNETTTYPDYEMDWEEFRQFVVYYFEPSKHTGEGE